MNDDKNVPIMFGIKLRSIRLSKNLSQEKLANLCGLHPTYISQAERGKRNVTLITLWKISKAAGCTVSELLQDLEQIKDAEN